MKKLLMKGSANDIMDRDVKTVSIKQIIKLLGNLGIEFEISVDENETIVGFSPVEQYRGGTITWIKNMQRYWRIDENAKKEVIEPKLIVVDSDVSEVCGWKNKLVVKNPKYVFYLILKEFFANKNIVGIGKGSIISESVILGDNVSIGSGCVVEDDVCIGNNTKIYHNVVLRSGTVIGKNCVIKSCTVIGEEGYGYSESGEGNGWFHVPHFGKVVVGDEVEIGSNCSIDCGTIENTIIGNGTKIDNLVHIAHNAIIGEYVRVVAGTVICGSSHIKDRVYIAPGGIIKNQIKIEENSIIGVGTVVLENVPKGKVLVGMPARVLRDVGKEDL